MRQEGLERVLVRQGRRSGATIAIAVHSTKLGPALGGARLWRYRSPDEGIADARRLGRAMTFKAAAAGLELGGGKGVICAPADERPDGRARRDLLLDFGDAVESLGGRYVTAEDVGTSSADMETIAERTTHVVGLPLDRGGMGDPSPLTARGVHGAIRACLEHRFGSSEVAGRRICVVGAGQVGGRLARLLHADGADLVISDIDPRLRILADELEADWSDPGQVLEQECDVLAPCALGGLIAHAGVGRLRCGIVCGAANNILSEDRVAEELAAQGVLYAPDFIVNAGGLINVYAELCSLERAEVEDLVDRVGETTARVLAEASGRGVSPLAAARELALARLRDPAPVAA